MKALETILKVQNGEIHVPIADPNMENTSVKVIVMWEEAVSKPEEKKERLLALQAKAKKSGLFSDIIDPVQWQKQLRDEWS